MRNLISEVVHINARISITTGIMAFGKDLLIFLSGGDEHIGSVSFVTAKELRTLADPPHKEGVITEMVVKIFNEKQPDKRIVVVSGIHFDSIGKNDITQITEKCRLWAEKAAERISGRNSR